MKRMRALAFACLATSPVHGMGEELGRLFFSPAEREALENGRRDAARGAAADPAPVRIDGVLLRSGRPGVVWMNGTASELRSEANASPARSPGAVALRVGGETRVEVRVGSTFDSAAGTTRDLIESGAISARRR